MAVNSGQVKRFQINGTEYDPSGDWTINESRNKYEHKESTQRGNHYFSAIRQPGNISGAINIRGDQDTSDLTEAVDAPVLVETPSGDVYQGTVTYTGDAENAINDGTLQVELQGEVGLL